MEQNYNLNEKIKWSNLLLALGLTYLGVSKYNEFDKIKNIYKVVNSENSIPTSEESNWIEKIRQEVIEEVKSSNLFNKFDKKYIIDSIQTINFRIVDNKIPFSENARACYIYIKPMKSKFKYLFKNDIPANDNFIIINREYMKDSDFHHVIVHEIYHYFDRLLSNDMNLSYSIENKISKFLDSNLNDEKYIKDKIMKLMLFSNDKGEKENWVVNLIYDDFNRNRKYLSSEKEIFARYKTIKHKMKEKGIIPSINTPISIDILAEYLISMNTLERSEDVIDLIPIDLKKIQELDKLL